MLKFDKEKLNNYAEKSGIKFVVLFGSQAMGNTAKESDFDIAVSFKNGKSIFDDLKKYSEILENFSKIFSIGDEKIDLTDLNNANILLRYEITRNGIILFGDPQDYEELRAFSFRDYIDAKSLFELEDIIIKKRLLFIKERLAV